MKKVLKYTGISLLIIIIILICIPIFFKGKILKIVKAEINKNIEAKVDFKDLSLSWFRHFPKLTIGLEDVSVVGINEFAKDTLLSAKNFDASVNIMSVIKGENINVYGVYLNSPRIHALVNEDGKANWDVTKPDTTSRNSESEPSPFQLKLEKYSITDGYVLYDDKGSGIYAEITDVDHEGSGDFTNELFTLSTKTKTGTASFTYDNLPYLVNAQTDVDADIDIDTKTNTYSFKNAALSVNDLKLLGNGFFRLTNDSTYDMDIKFDAPSNDFKNILSLLPAIYKNDFDKLKTSGKAAFKGFVKGRYSPTQLPAYDINLNVKDGFFQYPDLPQPVKNIQVEARFSNPDGVFDNTVVNISEGHLEMGAEPFDFNFLFKNPETTQYIDAVVKGKLNLSNVSKFVKLDDGTKLSGQVWADAFAKGSLSALQNQKGDFSAGGFFDISNFYFSSKDVAQPIQNGSFKVQLENNGGIADATNINVSSAHVEIGNDPIDFSLQLNHPVSTVDFNGKAKGRFSLDHIKQFVALEQSTSIKGLLNADLSFSGSKKDVDESRFDKINTTGVVNLSNVNYVSKDYPKGVQVSTAQLNFNPKNASLNNFDGNVMGTHLTASGILNNMIGYALHHDLLTGSINIAADEMNLNDWMSTDTMSSSSLSSSSSVAAPFAVPANMNLMLNAKANAVQYDQVTYNNVKGTLLLKDETVQLQNLQTEALDGNITFNGSYSTKSNKTKPDISLSYDVKNVDIQKAFFAYNTMQKIMPLGKFLGGKLSSQFSMTGKLGEDMMPDLSSLTGNGSLLLIQGILSKFAPLDKLASTLNVPELKDISLKDIKTHFEFTNGKVLVNPFNLKVKDIEMQIGGMHGIDQSIDYIIAMKLPRKYMGNDGNALVNNLAAQANNKGIPVILSDVVDLNIKMGGSISSPTIKTDLKQVAGDATKELKQQATDFVQQKIDSTKQTVKDSLNAVKKQVMNDVKSGIQKQFSGNKDSTSKGTTLDSTKKKAEETLKKTIDGLFKKKKGN